MSTNPAEIKKRKSHKQAKPNQPSLFDVVATADRSPDGATRVSPVKKVKKFEEYEQTKPIEMSVFEMLAAEDKKYSSSIELYDFMPKYHWGKVDRINEQFLLSLKREFECRGVKYKVTIHPARIEDSEGQIRDYYPSQREELIEDALRKLASNGQGLFLDDQASVTFTLHQLRHELEHMGHGYKVSEIKDALLVCANASIEVKSEDGTTILMSHIFETVGLHTEENWEGSGQKTKAFVRFNPLVTRSIKNRAFRQLNYEISMSYRSVIARQLHKRISHHYTQASLANTYDILLSTIIRDFGLKARDRVIHNLRAVKLALEEMVEKEIILEFDIQKIMDAKKSNKLADAKIVLRPHPRFAGEMIRANKRQGNIK